MRSEQTIKTYLKTLKEMRIEKGNQMYNSGQENLNKIIETLEWVLNKK